MGNLNRTWQGSVLTRLWWIWIFVMRFVPWIWSRDMLLLRTWGWGIRMQALPGNILCGLCGCRGRGKSGLGRQCPETSVAGVAGAVREGWCSDQL